jgi:MFS family permease
VILTVAAIANFISAPGQTYTFAVFLDHFRDDLGLSSTLISTLYLVGSLTAAVMVVGIGRALDVLGGRVMLVLSGTLIGFGAIWMSQVSNAIELLIGFAILRTLGQGSLSLIPTTLVSIWFTRKRAKALAIMALGGALASGVFPIMSNGLISAFDWRGAWIGIALISWGLLVLPAAIFARRSPESIGQLPDGEKPLPTRASAGIRVAEELAFTVKQAVSTRALWLLMFAASAQSMVGTGLMFHQISIFGERGLSSATAAAVFGAIAPALIVGMFISGFLADRLPIRYLIAAAQLSITALVLSVFLLSQPWHAYLYGVLFGLTMGFLMNSTTSIWPNYFGRKHLGSIRGVTQFSNMAAAAAGPLPLAIAFDATDSYATGLIIFAIIPLICAVAALFATKPTTPRRTPS